MLVLEQQMREMQWSRAELARRAQLNQVTVGAIINGRAKPYPVQLEKLARALRWPVRNADELMGEVDDGE